MIFEVTHRYPQAYVHRHKLHKQSKSFNVKGVAEMYMLLSRIKCLIEGVKSEEELKFSIANSGGLGSKVYIKRNIYPTHPHCTADNHFSGEHVLDFAGRKEFVLTLTTRRDRFQKGLQPYFHCKKLQPASTKAKRVKVM